MLVPSSLPCWKLGCSGRQHYKTTVISPRGRERFAYSCTHCDYLVEIAPEDLADYITDYAEGNSDLRQLLATALARVKFDEDGVYIS
jgi:hypothetical protein